ncbi:MAG: HAMP domain-containing histidine kinase [Bdellovibrionales bacterium]|nr:HAMP domain-containing histidine kinase [Oligoflexia bacterium]
MKLEKVVTRPRKGRWIFLFILGLAVAGVMATSYNFEVIRQVSLNEVPWTKITFGTFGFIAIIVSLILFFMRLLNEMKISQIQADFLDRISHELRTPLSTLTLVSDLLKGNSEVLSEEQKRLWNSHDLELTRLKTDVELLLQAARLREARLKVNMEEVDLMAWVKERWPSFLQLLGPNALLSLSVSSAPQKVLIDSSLFELILRNLLDNARKFSLGQPVVEMKISILPAPAFWGKKRWQVMVKDHGLGFSPSQEEELFRRFSRLEVATPELQTQSIPGTGLGLYLSASASKAMNLTLSGQSLGEGTGAEFKIVGHLK